MAKKLSPRAAGKETKTILLVEDESSIRKTLCNFLRDCGYLILEANDGAEALEVARRHRKSIDLLLTDVVMPTMSAGELTRRLKLLRPEMKVLYISGRVTESQLLDPNTPFLRKPFRLEELARKLREVLSDR